MTGKEILDQFNIDMQLLREQMNDPNTVKDNTFFENYNQQINKLTSNLNTDLRGVIWS
jgi:hypothetical protein